MTSPDLTSTVAILGSIGLLILIYTFISKYLIPKIIISTSETLPSVIEIYKKNKKNFIKYDAKYEVKVVTKTKRQYDNFDLDRYLFEEIRWDNVVKIYENSLKNSELVDSIIDSYQLYSKGTQNRSKFYRKIEEKIYNKYLDKVKSKKNVIVNVKVSYTTPAGRNHYSKILTKDGTELIDFMNLNGVLLQKSMMKDNSKIFFDDKRDSLSFSGVYGYTYPSMIKENSSFPIKIGKTDTEIGKRVKEQTNHTSTPENPIILMAIPRENFLPYEIEKHLHRLFFTKRIVGGGSEWFNLTTSELYSSVVEYYPNAKWNYLVFGVKK